MKYLLLLFSAATFSSLAFAHVTIESNNMTAGGYAKLTFRVPHGCDGSATTKITVQLAEGILSVKPQVHPGWKISTKSVKLKNPATLHGKAVTESISEVTWSGGSLPDMYMDEFGMSVKLPDEVSGALYFPVIQECKKGKSSWVETNQEAQFPAPSLTLTASTKKDEHHH